MLPLILIDAMPCFISSLDPCLDYYFKSQFSVLFTCVGHWNTQRPTLDAGVSSVLFICMFIFAAMLESCFLLSYILAPYVLGGVWALWLLFSRYANSFQGYMWICMGFVPFSPYACFT